MTRKSHPEYGVWKEMRRRCLSPKNHAYDRYGGRGIKICPEWEDYETFRKDMGPRPDGLALDRKDTNGPYCKENCRWATPKEQADNKRTYKNGLGVGGVCWLRQKVQGAWEAYYYHFGKKVRLYHGLDLFEAVCQRRSWEVRRDS